jgi:hypothetical protein
MFHCRSHAYAVCRQQWISNRNKCVVGGFKVTRTQIFQLLFYKWPKSTIALCQFDDTCGTRKGARSTGNCCDKIFSLLLNNGKVHLHVDYGFLWSNGWFIKTFDKTIVLNLWLVTSFLFQRWTSLKCIFLSRNWWFAFDDASLKKCISPDMQENFKYIFSWTD